MTKEISLGDAPAELQAQIEQNPFFSGVLNKTEATGIRLEALQDDWIDPGIGNRVHKAYRVLFVGLPRSHSLNSHNGVIYAQTKQGDRWRVTVPTDHFTGR